MKGILLALILLISFILTSQHIIDKHGNAHDIHPAEARNKSAMSLDEDLTLFTLENVDGGHMGKVYTSRKIDSGDTPTTINTTNNVDLKGNAKIEENIKTKAAENMVQNETDHQIQSEQNNSASLIDQENVSEHEHPEVTRDYMGLHMADGDVKHKAPIEEISQEYPEAIIRNTMKNTAGEMPVYGHPNVEGDML